MLKCWTCPLKALLLPMPCTFWTEACTRDKLIAPLIWKRFENWQNDNFWFERTSSRSIKSLQKINNRHHVKFRRVKQSSRSNSFWRCSKFWNDRFAIHALIVWIGRAAARRDRKVMGCCGNKRLWLSASHDTDVKWKHRMTDYKYASAFLCGVCTFILSWLHCTIEITWDMFFCRARWLVIEK